MKHSLRKQDTKSALDFSCNSDDLPEYLDQLEAQCSIRIDAVKIAEDLINAYRQQNQQLRVQNKCLKQQLSQSDSFPNPEIEKHNKSLQKTVLQHSQKISKLLQTNILYEQRISQMQRELRDIQFVQNSCEKGKKTHHKNILVQEQKQNYGIRTNKNHEQNLKYKLQQKDDEILHLLKRLNHLEQLKNNHQTYPLKSNHKKAVFTFSTGFPTPSKRLNSSIQSMQV